MLRRAAAILLGLFMVDLLLVVVTGSSSLLPPSPVGPLGFALRAALVGSLLVLRFRVLADRHARLSGARLFLLLLLLPTLMQFQFAGGRINGDGLMYYAYVRSLLKDGDIDFTNEYTHYGLIGRGDLAVPTKTGLRRSIFSIGPAVLWTPFFLLGESVARLQGWLGAEPDLSGYGPAHRNAVALGSLLYGFAAILLIHDLLRRHLSEAAALGGALLVWGTTFLHWYMVQQPTMSHASSAFMATLALWLWDRDRGRRTATGFFAMGLVLGLAMAVRWQNGVLLLLPGLELIASLRGAPARLKPVAGAGALLAGGTLMGAAPQMLAWKALYDMWVLPYPPHGADFVRFDHPFLLQTFFSSRHGLLSWTPSFWAGYLGFLPLLKRRPAIALPLLLPLVLMTYVNICSGDWWAGGSFSNRRFDSLLPFLAFGFAAALEAGRRFIARRPGAILGFLAALLVLWNATLMEQVRRGVVPRDDTVSFPRLVGGGARLLSNAVGFPTTWPASWTFSWRQKRPPGQYDLLVGRYLFYRQNNLGGRIDLGAPGDEAMLGEGWGPAEARDGVSARRIRRRARLFAPLDVAEDLQIRLRARSLEGGREVSVQVNGREAGRIWAGAAWDDQHMAAGASFWRRELNDVVLDVGEGEVLVDAVDFARVGR